MLFQLEDLVKGTVVKRPSATCKSPYVADVILETGDSILAHAPALGCDGLSDKGGVVYLSNIITKKDAVCTHRIELAETPDGIIVGINPKLAERIVESAIMKSNDVKRYKREKTILNSRFDFIGTHSNDKNFVLEVKTVPLLESPGVAFFPHGYRKKKGDVVSPRALKHLNDLIDISLNSDAESIMCYVIQRSDANSFIPSPSDTIYRNKLFEAKEKGVTIMTLYVEWNREGMCFFKKKDNF